MRNLTILLVMLFSMTTPPTSVSKEKNDKDDSPIYLVGRVKDDLMKQDLTNAKAILYDGNGNPVDSARADQGTIRKHGEIVKLSFFRLPVERKDTVYSFDIVCPGYQTQTVVYRLEKPGKREINREIPGIFLKRAPRQLGEVTVTASKIKFYNKGDTIVYNADAFQLAEGSMLDALITQLPGVELKDDGQITVNGEFVESLLLNGNQFLDGNNQLMLDNIGAYTVKNVEVYKGNTKEDKWLDDPTIPKQLTMNVKLKREYNMGWLINAQGGYGTEDRYMGRLFASWFTPTTTLTILGNINNLNDNRKPGKNDNWTPDMMQAGTKRYKMASLNYGYEHPDGNAFASGSATIEETTNNILTTTQRTNFLEGQNTYDYIFDNARDRKLKITTDHTAFKFTNSLQLGGRLKGSYIRTDNTSASVSGTFDSEQAGITREVLESLYSGSSDDILESVINRSITRSDSRKREGRIEFAPQFRYKIPRTEDYIQTELRVTYKTEKEDLWKDYNINFGNNHVPAQKRRQYFDNSPNRTLNLGGFAEYTIRAGNAILALNYEYLFTMQDKDSYMYALDRLTDMGVFGYLPSDYIDTFDPSNSYTTRFKENRHTLTPIFRWNHVFRNNNRIMVSVAPKLRLQYRHMDYYRAEKDYLITQNSYLTALGNYSARATYSFGKAKNSRRENYRNEIDFEYRLTPSSPDLTHMVDIEDNADPMNISIGNPNLKNAYEHKQKLSWIYNCINRPLRNTLTLTTSQTTNALVRGYTYDTSTGIRVNKTYNVDGNNYIEGTNIFSIQFGKRQQFTLTSSTTGSLTDYADMIGVNTDIPVKSTVTTSLFRQTLRAGWQIGKQNIEIKGEAVARKTTSTREDFSPINARHFNYGIIGHFRLPGGFGINTDFTCYTRRGYGSKELDTTDAILNLGITFTPRKSRWVLMADGFDLLHRLSNVHYAVNASGRTISYTNTLPRYVLFTVQYRLNIQPKKR